jgi:hypothetical protein
MPKAKASAPEQVTLHPEELIPPATTAVVVNINRSGGTITDLNGKTVPVGGTCELPIKTCESLLAAGIARYPFRGEYE